MSFVDKISDKAEQLPDVKDMDIPTLCVTRTLETHAICYIAYAKYMLVANSAGLHTKVITQWLLRVRLREFCKQYRAILAWFAYSVHKIWQSPAMGQLNISTSKDLLDRFGKVV